MHILENKESMDSLVWTVQQSIPALPGYVFLFSAIAAAYAPYAANIDANDSKSVL